MTERKLRIAIVSDLHCHPEESDPKNNGTLLFTDKLRDNAKEHPIESLKELKTKDEFDSVDILICPGDLTHQSNKQGMLTAWSYLHEMVNIFDAKEIYTTLGNHDIDSRHKYSQYSFTIPKGIKQSFPLKENEEGSFWTKGYTFIEKEDFQLLIFNSTHYHTHTSPVDNQAVKGLITPGTISEIETYLENSVNDKIKIMLCHHHPVQHSRDGLGPYDFIENGEELVNVLGKFNFDLIIHGHKHDPNFREYSTTDGYKIPILSAGSFSATGQQLYINKFNYFHLIEIHKSNNSDTKGTIQTWNFINRSGWSKKMNGFLPRTGFGVNDSVEDIFKKISNFLEVGKPYTWNEVLNEFPDLNFLLPNQLEEFEEKSSENKIIVKPCIQDNPTTIFRHE
jgi:predicted phosphodiesterase